MRIAIDMQGAQTESRFRGIGRYTMAFAQAVVRNRGEHEVFLVLSGMFPDTIEPIRAVFDDLLPQENIRVWTAPGPTTEKNSGNDIRREIAELIREAFFASLQPDVIHLSSLFEGFTDDAVTSIGRFDTATPVSVILYDLIPLLNSEHYLKPNPAYSQYYRRKVEFLRKASLHLAISEFARQEGIKALDTPEDQIVTISTAADTHIQAQEINDELSRQIRLKFGITRPFVLYTGGADERKNLPRLIKAYAALPERLRISCQMVFAGKMPVSEVSSLKRVAQSTGLGKGELTFTGHVSEDELVQLYNLCHLYVFPSWHEGFGLPALEAMACGAPVIGANTSSLPEVIGLSEALFPPLDVDKMSAKLAQAMEDESFRNRLRDHGLNQAKKFSWDETAKKALAAWESLPLRDSIDYLDRSLAHERLLTSLAGLLVESGKAELIAVSDCLSKNGSAGTHRQLLVDVSELCQKDAATGVQRVVRSYLKCLLQSPPAGFRVEPVFATIDAGYRYARNFTQQFLGLDDKRGAVDSPVNWQRGDVFFGLDMQHHVQLAHAAFFRQLVDEGVVVKFLVHDLLPIQLAGLFKDSGAKRLHERWLAMIALTDGAICVSRSTAEALEKWIDSCEVVKSRTFDSCWVHNGADIDGSMPSYGLAEGAEATLDALHKRPSFLCVSTIEPRKCQQQILEAVERLWAEDVDVNLVLVGQEGWKTRAFSECLNAHPEAGERLFWLKGISDEYLEKVYAASTCLIAASLNEGFGLSLIEAARHGIPIIARDIPVFREVAGTYADYFTGESPLALAEALRNWLVKFESGTHRSSKGMPWLTWDQSTEKLKRALVEQNCPRQQLLVDVSELVQRDAKSGIQRVVRNILKEWILNPPLGWRIEPVYATADKGYRYARNLRSTDFNNIQAEAEDDVIQVGPGDIFLGLDLSPAVVPYQRLFYRDLRAQGVQVKFLIYDLQPLIPDYFDKVHEEAFLRWLYVAVESNEIICISKSVKNEVQHWLESNNPTRPQNQKISYFHLGADIVELEESEVKISDEESAIIERMKEAPSLLMVSTLAPHKAHAQVLNALEILWANNVDVNLVLVGKEGWRVDRLVENLENHSELGKRLFWLRGISDQFLELLYRQASGLIAASYTEGFGLPLIEAAQYGLPIIARDIPTFREVAGDHAFYFDSKEPEELAQSVQEWLNLYGKGQHPSSKKMPWLTWKQSANQLLSLVIPDYDSESVTEKDIL